MENLASNCDNYFWRRRDNEDSRKELIISKNDSTAIVNRNQLIENAISHESDKEELRDPGSSLDDDNQLILEAVPFEDVREPVNRSLLKGKLCKMGSEKKRGRRWEWNWSDITLISIVVFFVLISYSPEVLGKGDMMPEDDFDSSNKKVRFEDFDTNVTPIPSGGAGAAHGITSTKTPGEKDGKTAGSLGFIHAFIASYSVIVVSELGDKTFFIAAIMAMRHPRVIVFAGAMSALALMTVLSALFGYATTIIPKNITYYISTALFAFFGFKMIYDGIRMSPDEGAEELEEVQQTLRRRDDDNDVESQSTGETPPASQGYKLPTALRRILFSCFSRIFLQALTMTFLAEWGDRSQIATIILAAREDVAGVCIGGTIGHGCCTGLAVLGGRMIAQKISVRQVTIIGGVVFLLFALTSLFINPE